MEDPVSWSVEQVEKWLCDNNFESYTELMCKEHRIDGKVLLCLTENDLKQPPIQMKVFGDIKRLIFSINKLKNQFERIEKTPSPNLSSKRPGGSFSHEGINSNNLRTHRHISLTRTDSMDSLSVRGDPEDEQGMDSYSSIAGFLFTQERPVNFSKNLDSEIWKTLLSFIYAFLVFFLTSFVMVVVHDRVPDMEKYPPLPDIFLDNVPYIPWAFKASEIIAVFLGLTWLTILIFHKHRFILMRRMFSLMGTIYLLRCVTMLITSLSVPGVHLKCEGKLYGDLGTALHRTIEIWTGMGMSISGVRTCGDYMFSGHTVCITLLNFFITEYTSRRKLYPLHMLCWVANMFGLFFILAGHEHYSIDVFVAFYISSRLFLYYHVLANNRSLMLRDNSRRRFWFPLFSFFESKCDGMVPNVFEWPFPSIQQVICAFKTFVIKPRIKSHKDLKTS